MIDLDLIRLISTVWFYTSTTAHAGSAATGLHLSYWPYSHIMVLGLKRSSCGVLYCYVTVNASNNVISRRIKASLMPFLEFGDLLL